MNDRTSAAARPVVDTRGRTVSDLRFSLTDRCNMRCRYCMPREGLTGLNSSLQLTDDEVIRLVTIAVRRLGITNIRFTGGEPLLRRGLEDIIAATTALGPVTTAITTNGLGLEHRAPALAEAGLTRVNVSLDTIDPFIYADITGRDRLEEVLRGLETAAAHGLRPVKVNAVLLPGINVAGAPDLLSYCLERGYRLRFIEQMPLDAQHGWSRTGMITAEQITALLQEHFSLSTVPTPRGSTPAEDYLVDGGPGTVGIIASVTRPFCEMCDRTRVTADGQLRNCLFALDETDLRALLRSGAGDDRIEQAWRANAGAKLPGHHINDEGFVQPTRPMSAIGG